MSRPFRGFVWCRVPLLHCAARNVPTPVSSCESCPNANNLSLNELCQRQLPNAKNLDFLEPRVPGERQTGGGGENVSIMNVRNCFFFQIQRGR